MFLQYTDVGASTTCIIVVVSLSVIETVTAALGRLRFAVVCIVSGMTIILIDSLSYN